MGGVMMGCMRLIVPTRSGPPKITNCRYVVLMSHLLIFSKSPRSSSTATFSSRLRVGGEVHGRGHLSITCGAFHFSSTRHWRVDRALLPVRDQRSPFVPRVPDSGVAAML